MDRKIQKIKKYINTYLHKDLKEIIKEFGTPTYPISDEIIIYTRIRKLIFREDIAFVIKDEIVMDIIITEFIFNIGLWNIMYYRDEFPKYKLVIINKYLGGFFPC